MVMARDCETFRCGEEEGPWTDLIVRNADSVSEGSERMALALSPDRCELPPLVDAMLSGLTVRQQAVLRRRFGLRPFDREHTLEETGQLLDRPISRERVRQIENLALRVLRHPRKHRPVSELRPNCHIRRVRGRVEEWGTCPRCDGTGLHNTFLCWSCRGTGKVWVPRLTPLPWWLEQETR